MNEDSLLTAKHMRALLAALGTLRNASFPIENASTSSSNRRETVVNMWTVT